MSRIPLPSDRPIPAAILVSVAVKGALKARTAVLVVLEPDDEAASEDAPPARPGLARCLPDNVIALRTARRSA